MLRTALVVLCGAMLPVAAATPAAEPEAVPRETTPAVTVQHTGPARVRPAQRCDQADGAWTSTRISFDDMLRLP
jgi:hypothetical protein